MSIEQSLYFQKTAAFAADHKETHPDHLKEYLSSVHPGKIFTLNSIETATQEWNAYVGGIWGNIFQTGSLDWNGKIIEVAPGEKSKIGLGVKHLHPDFSGKFTVIEPESDALSKIVDQYTDLFPNARIVALQATLDSYIAKISNPPFLVDEIKYYHKQVDALVCNHGIDDMIVGKSLTELDRDALFHKHYDNSEAGQTANAWHNLIADDKKLTTIKNQVVQEWVSVTELTSPRLLGLSAYRSFFFEENCVTYPELVEADYQALETLSTIRHQLHDRNYQTCMIDPEQLINSPQNWAVMMPKALAT